MNVASRKFVVPGMVEEVHVPAPLAYVDEVHVIGVYVPLEVGDAK